MNVLHFPYTIRTAVAGAPVALARLAITRRAAKLLVRQEVARVGDEPVEVTLEERGPDGRLVAVTRRRLNCTGPEDHQALASCVL